jgi:hypothetical protein
MDAGLFSRRLRLLLHRENLRFLTQCPTNVSGRHSAKMTAVTERNGHGSGRRK